MQLNIVAIVKASGEKFLFLFDDVSAGEVGEAAEAWAADRELNFDRYDAAVVQDRVCGLLRQSAGVLDRPE